MRMVSPGLWRVLYHRRCRYSRRLREAVCGVPGTQADAPLAGAVRFDLSECGATTQSNQAMIRVVGKARTGDIVVARSSNCVTTLAGSSALAARGSPETRCAVVSVHGRVRRQRGRQ